VRVGKEWGAGKKGQDRGIVLALSTRDRRVYIATGYAVEERQSQRYFGRD